MFENVPEQELSEFNSNFAYLERLHEHLKQIGNLTAEQNYTKLFHTLVSFYKELCMDMDEKTESHMLKLYSEAKQGYLNIKNDILKNKGRILYEDIDSLNNFDMELRKYMQSKGLGFTKQRARGLK